MENRLNSRWKTHFRKRLIEWYDKEFRDLPWRGTSSPYEIWISEIMLQQTQVKKVIPYYKKFLHTFPTVNDLANADLSQVLKVWEGLGYYARARNLHKAAKIVVNEHHGAFPSDPEQVRNLPGIGAYTAAAILSIAFGQNLPVLDGNVIRVLSRLFAIDLNTKSAQGKSHLLAIARELLQPGLAGTFNQAMMELGAMVCTPKSPKCGECPLAKKCRAKETNTINSYPIKTPKKERPHYHIAVGIIWRGDEILIARRPEEGLLGGLWEFPGGKLENGETLQQAVAREISEELDVQVSVQELLTVIKHQYTHFKITLHAFHCQYLSGVPKAIGCTEWRWVKKEELDAFAFPTANRKILNQLLQE